MSFLRLKARTRIAFGLVCMLMSVLSTAMLLGLVPDREDALRKGRADLCQTLSMVCSDHVSNGSHRRLDQLLDALVRGNEDVVSAAVLRADGRLMSSFGEHVVHWGEDSTDHTAETHVSLPVRRGKERWGTVKIGFSPVEGTAWYAGWVEPWMLLSSFIGLASFLLFQMYLKKMLAHLDPSKSVPKRVRTALDSLAEGLLVLDRSGRIVLANQSFAEWISCDAEQLLGRQADELSWHLETSGGTPWRNAIESESVVAGAMIELCLPGKPKRTLIANASPVLGQEGKCRGVLVSFDDVTQLEKTKRDLTVAKRAADQANQAKSEFLARMSHEIRTPMNAILGYTEVLRRGFDTTIEDRREYLDTIHGSGEHLLALINDILDLSKVESGQLQLELGEYSPYKVVQDVVALLKSKADEKQIGLSTRVEGAIPKTALGDSVRLRQAIVNLVGNAIKFTDEGSVEIVLRCHRSVDAEHPTAVGMLQIAVNDTGIGISEQAQAKIFEPFAQADTSITRRFGGTGLGLAISKQLAEAMGGGISLTSTPGKGTRFTIEVSVGPWDDLELIDPDTDADARSLGIHVAHGVGHLPPCHVLVADDGSANRKLVQLVLGQAGAKVTGVEDGQQALDAVESQDFDVILMDMQMPVLDGYAATRVLRESGFDRPILALTANAMQGDQEKCLAAGCDGFLPKPIKIDHLVNAIAEALGVTEQERATLSIGGPASGNNSPAKCDSRSDRAAPPPPSGQQTKEEATMPIDEGHPVRCSYPLDDPDFLEIAEDFVHALRNRLPEMIDALNNALLDPLARDAHWLKGVSGSAGFDVFVQPAFELQQAAQASDHDRCVECLSTIERLAARIDLPSEIAQSPIPTSPVSHRSESPEAQSGLDRETPAVTMGAEEPIRTTLPLDDEELKDIFMEFLELMEKRFVRMNEALVAEQWDELARAAHWLRGTGGQVGIAAFASPTRKLEQQVQRRDFVGCRTALDELQALAARIEVPVER